MKNLHIFSVAHVWDARTETPKVRIRSERFDQTVRIPYTNERGASSPVLDTAYSYLESKGFAVTGHGEAAIGFVITSETFKPLKP